MSTRYDIATYTPNPADRRGEAMIIAVTSLDTVTSWDVAKREWPKAIAEELDVETLEGATGGASNGGLWYTAELAGPDGIAVVLYVEPHHTNEDIKRAKAWVKNERDVVSIRLFVITKWVEPTEEGGTDAAEITPELEQADTSPTE